MTDRLILWGRSSSANVQRMLWTLSEAGLEAERRIVGGAYGGLDTAEFAALSPAGTIPVVQDGDVVLWQTAPAMRHVAARHAPALFPPDPRRRAEIESWMDWTATVAWPPVRGLYACGWLGRPADPAQLRKAIDTTACRADAALARREWIAGDTFSIADITLGITYNRLTAMGETVPWPNLSRWLAAARARPGFAVVDDTLPPRPDPA